MTWHAAEMPDDALDPTSLVGSMLNPESVPPELVVEALEFLDEYDADFKALAASERAELPLWRVMLKAGMHAEWCGPGTVRHSVAAEIKALRDWMLPEELEPSFADNAAEWFAWHERQRLRAQLTEQARIARGD